MDVDEREKLPEKGIWLARYPDNEVKRFKSYVLNRLKFRTKDSEANWKTQNNGISVATEGGVTYYGVLTNIIELNYSKKLRYVLFKCEWVDVDSGKGYETDKFGFSLVNFTRLIHKGDRLIDESYVLTSQASQVFYVEDSMHKDWMVIVKTKARDVFDIGTGASFNDDVDNFCENVPYDITTDNTHDVNDNLAWTHRNVEGTIYEIPLFVESELVEDDNIDDEEFIDDVHESNDESIDDENEDSEELNDGSTDDES